MKSRLELNGLRFFAIVLLFAVSLNALAAGFSFLTDPSGRGLGITTNYLRSSAPFADYFVPGIVLFIILGVLSSFIAVMAIRKAKSYPMLLIMQGCIIVGWIAIQLTMVTAYHPLHLIVALIGFILITIGLVLRKSHGFSTPLPPL